MATQADEATRRAGVIRPGDPGRDARMLVPVAPSRLHALVRHQIDGSQAGVAARPWAFCAAAPAPT